MTEQQPTKELETKPATIDQEVDLKEEESKPLVNNTANKQIKARPRYPPRAPGFFPPTLENVIAMAIQLFITIWSFFTIFGSISVARDRDDVAWIIICEIIFTFTGFAYFTSNIKRNVIVYNKFYKKISEWRGRKLEQISNGDADCCATKWLLVQLAYYLYTVLIFPIVIIWSMWQTFRFYQDRRKSVHSDIYTYTDKETNLAKSDNNDRLYSVFDLGVLSKEASMVTLFIQDLPLMIICAIIGNWTFFVVYIITILQKLIFWMKYMYDLGAFRIFYNKEDYMNYFGIKKLEVTVLEEDSNWYFIMATPYTKEEMELLTLQEGDWIRIWVGNEEEYIPDKAECDDNNYKVMRVYKNKHFKVTENLVCVDIHGTSIEKLDDYFEGKTKKLDVPSENFHTINRWDVSLHLELLDDEMYEKYYNKVEKNGDNVDESDEKQDDRTNVIESDGNMNDDELDTEIKSNENGTEVTNGVYNDTGDESNDAAAIDMKKKGDMNDGVIANNVNNNEKNVVAGVNSNKETQVENQEIVNDKPESVIDDTIQTDDVENNETDKLNDSPVVIDVDDVNEEENDHGRGGSGGDDEYVPVPLTANDEINENES